MLFPDSNNLSYEGLVYLLLTLYTVTIRMGEKATFFSLPVSDFADVVEVVVLWFSSGLYSSLWG
ncbi:hypothetical protein CWM53_16465 [Klebsiella sp. A-Nf5]|nr:hypothetical protein CWM53_16465 [Klebsiella sp. A-Nf5]PJX40683.1 hypothetical protein CWM62_23150 [Klebsiella sp. C-Nf10]PJX51147.1 hypothetical protein CWM54_24595 [Klebsiella sp. D-Nf1]